MGAVLGIRCRSVALFFKWFKCGFFGEELFDGIVMFTLNSFIGGTLALSGAVHFFTRCASKQIRGPLPSLSTIVRGFR
jgi:hypothetical protein